MVLLRKFKTLLDLFAYFKDDQICREYLAQIRWAGKVQCPYEDCLHDKCFTFSNGINYKCSKCERRFTVKVGTIFHDSKISLQKWYAAIYLITSHKKGISSHQLAKDIGITQKTAWYVLHRVRFTLGIKGDVEKLKGKIEADETFIGGNEKNKHKNKRTEGTQGRSVKTKSAVAGVVSRGGEIRAKKVDATSGYYLKPFVIKNVEFGSTLHTDEHLGYKGLAQVFKHQHVQHGAGEYVLGDCHTNTMEGFWSLLKRGLMGIYHSVSAKHLQQYIDEFVFRYNTRQMNESNRFDAMLNQMAVRLTYQSLIANGDSGNNRQMEAKQGTLGF
jgi:transposase-like protein